MANVSVTITKKAYKGNEVGSTVELPSPRAKLLVGLGRAAYADAAPRPVNNTPTSQRASEPVASEAVDTPKTTGKPAAKRAPAKKTAAAKKSRDVKTGGKPAGYNTRAMKAAK
jgi:hypothetical protein